jgi:hypothetical protein
MDLEKQAVKVKKDTTILSDKLCDIMRSQFGILLPDIVQIKMEYVTLLNDV